MTTERGLPSELVAAHGGLPSATRLDPARQALLAQRLAGVRRPATAKARPPQVPARSQAEHEPVPLSASQYQLWYLSQVHPDSRAYNELVTVRKDGAFDVEAFRWAFNEVVRRHQAWRTVFITVDDEPRQVVREAVPHELPLHDFSHLDFDDAETAAADLAVADTREAYDLAAGPLLRPRLVRLSATHHRLYLGLHHLVFDGVSLYRVLLPELTALYNGRVADISATVSTLAPPAVQYPDYALWEQEWVNGAEAATRLARNKRRLGGVHPLELPQDFPRPARQGFVGGMHSFTVDADIVRGLRTVAAGHGATLFHALAAAYACWLHSYTGDTDVLFATATDLRQFPELETMIGYCLTPAVLRATISRDGSFGELIQAMRAEVVEAIATAVPFERLIRALDVPRDPRRNPLFQAMLVLEPPMEQPDPEWAIHQMETAISARVGQAKFDISIELDERPDGTLTGRLNYDSALFSASSARLMQQHFCLLLAGLLRSPGSPLGEVDVPVSSHPQTTNTPGEPSAGHLHVCQRILETARRVPDSMAVVIGDDRLSYAGTLARTRHIARQLTDAGVGRGHLVAAALTRNIDLVPGLLAILWCGAAYVPLNPHDPAVRLRMVLADSNATLVLADAESVTTLPTLDWPVLAITNNGSHGGKENNSTPYPVVDTDPAYLIYTSGSTGTPKGVVVEHGNLAALMANAPMAIGLSTSDTVVSVAAYTFDVSVGDIFMSLALGAQVVLATQAEVRDPRLLRALVETCDASRISATPTTFAALVRAGWAGHPTLLAAPAGEALPPELAAELRARCRVVWNGWGPTEACVYASGDMVGNDDLITIGRPFPETRILVLDDRNRLAPPGVPGELAVSGPQVTRGYLGRPAETATRYVADPFGNGTRVYRTADRGRRLADGRIQFLGRFDGQVKVRGFRIETGEVEAILVRHPQVRAAAVDARPDAHGEQHLVAYLVGTEVNKTVGNKATHQPKLRAWLRERLPDYLVPTTFVWLDTLPTTPAGKLDRRALPDSATKAPDPQIFPLTMATDTERAVAALWSTLLTSPVATAQDNFFDLGGHSMLAARILSRVQQEFDVTIALTDFLERGTTIAGLAELISSNGATGIRRDGHTPGARKLFMIFPDLASAMSMRHLTTRLETHPLLPMSQVTTEIPTTVEEFAAHVVDELRATQPHGPYTLAGFSFGGMVAYELARLLLDAGEQVEWLGIIDTPTPQLANTFIRRHRSPMARLAQLRLPDRRVRIRRYLSRLRWSLGERAVASGLRERPATDQIDLRHIWTIIRSYTRDGHDAPLSVFITADTAAQVNATTLGWDELHQGPVDLHYLTGDHNSVLDAEQAIELAELIRACLER